jgi:hypothetical protein
MDRSDQGTANGKIFFDGKAYASAQDAGVKSGLAATISHALQRSSGSAVVSGMNVWFADREAVLARRKRYSRGGISEDGGKLSKSFRSHSEFRLTRSYQFSGKSEHTALFVLPDASNAMSQPHDRNRKSPMSAPGLRTSI